MRMFVLAAAALLTPAASPQANPAEQPGAETPPVSRSIGVGQECRNPRIQQALERGTAPQLWKSDRMPKVEVELSVLRTVDGCMEPALLREEAAKQKWGGPQPAP